MKDLYKPGGKRNEQHIEVGSAEAEIKSGSEEHKNYLVNDQEAYGNKEIRMRMRSGARDGRLFEAYSSDKKSLADSHAKRLKVAKSTRITIDAEEKAKPSRFSRAMAAMGMEP